VMEFTLSRDDAHIADAAQTSDLPDIAAIYDRYFTQVYNYLRYRVEDAKTADDLTAQVFERVVQHRQRYQPEKAAFNTWLFAIARHVVSDHYRTQRRRRWLPLDVLRQQPSDTPALEKTMIANETNRYLLAEVAKLADRERELIAQRFGAGLTNRQIATMLNLTESNVGVILHRTLRHLKTRLTGVIDHE
jgi:RNA polymerase sigma factor (sigma-70 family)